MKIIIKAIVFIIILIFVWIEKGSFPYFYTIFASIFLLLTHDYKHVNS